MDERVAPPFQAVAVRSAPAASPPGTPESDLSLEQILRAIARRRGVVIGVIASLLLLAFAWTLIVTPRYAAEALVLIEPKDSPAALDALARGLSADQEAVQSEAYVLSSRALAERVIRRLKLDNEPEFNRNLADATMPPAQRLSAVIDKFLDRLDVEPREVSRVISVTFSAADPQHAAEIVNTLTDEYLLSGIEAKFENTRRASDWLNGRVAELQGEVRAAESRVEDLRRKFGLVASNSGTLSGQELSELNTQLVMARTARAEAQARLTQIQQLRRSRAEVATASEVLGSPLIQRLREQEAELQRQVAELATEYGERHPKMVQLRAQAADLQAKIDAEVDKIAAGLQNDVNIARARENAIESSLAASQNRVQIGNENEIALRAAEREAEAARTLLTTLLARQKEALSREDIESQRADARVIAAAGPPVEPSFPNRPVVLGLVFIASCFLGLLAVLVLELLDGGFRSGEQIEQMTGVASLGFIPRVAPEPGDSLCAFLRSRPKSAFGEALRTLHWSISLTAPDNPPRTVLITSAGPGEGKTTVAIGMAMVQSQAGQRVVLVDADTRRSRVQELTGVAGEPGLLDLLSGRASLDEVLRTPAGTNLCVITAGTEMPNPPGLLASRRMDGLLADLAERFDLVVIDSPPVMAAADARILAQKCAATAIVVRWATTRRQAVRLAIHQLQADGAKVAGAALTIVDARKHARYSYGDSGAYTGELEKYYSG
jgi:capsular exopolysaccharide synthesis family protein